MPYHSVEHIIELSYISMIGYHMDFMIKEELKYFSVLKGYACKFINFQNIRHIGVSFLI